MYKIEELLEYPGYGVSSDGKVWSRWVAGRTKRIGEVWHEKKYSLARGHPQVVLSLSGRKITRYVHRLVLRAFKGEPVDGLEGCHNDGNPLNNDIDNLRWDTRKNNQADRVKHGTHTRGERHGMAKLKESDLQIIRDLYSSGSPQCGIAKKFMVSPMTISNIINHKSWTHASAWGVSN
jgi:hypothetical protein